MMWRERTLKLSLALKHTYNFVAALSFRAFLLVLLSPSSALSTFFLHSTKFGLMYMYVDVTRYRLYQQVKSGVVFALIYFIWIFDAGQTLWANQLARPSGLPIGLVDIELKLQLW